MLPADAYDVSRYARFCALSIEAAVIAYFSRCFFSLFTLPSLPTARRDHDIHVARPHTSAGFSDMMRQMLPLIFRYATPLADDAYLLLLRLAVELSMPAIMPILIMPDDAELDAATRCHVTPPLFFAATTDAFFFFFFFFDDYAAAFPCYARCRRCRYAACFAADIDFDAAERYVVFMLSLRFSPHHGHITPSLLPWLISLIAAVFMPMMPRCRLFYFRRMISPRHAAAASLSFFLMLSSSPYLFSSPSPFFFFFIRQMLMLPLFFAAFLMPLRRRH